MDLKLRNTIIGGILIVSFSIASYFLYFIPKQKHLDNLVKCNKVGLELFEKEKVDYPQNTYFEPTFTFSEKLNTCVYKGGYSYYGLGRISSNTASRTNFIRDVYSNAYLAEYGFSGNDNNFGDREEYERLDSDIFNAKSN